MRWLCHLVPAVLCVLPLSGCFLFHGNGPCTTTEVRVCCDDATGLEVSPTRSCPIECPSGSTERAFCAGTGPVDAGAPPRSDAGPPDPPVPPLMCEPFRGASTCMDPLIVPPGQPFVLPVDLSTCGCCPESECAVEATSVDGRPTLRVTTTLCPDPCDCDACIPVTSQCRAPALDAGEWKVVVNGAPAFPLRVEEIAPGLVPPPPSCATYAEPDECALDEAIDTFAQAPSQVCVGNDPRGATMRMTVECPACGQLHGPCLATLRPRLTDDLPPGGEIELSLEGHHTDCDVDCPGVCIPEEVECRVPDLRRDMVYRVWVDGRPVGLFQLGESPCFDVSAPVPG